MTIALTGITLLGAEWITYLAARGILSFTGLSASDQIAMSFLASMACLASAAVYAWDTRAK